MRDIYTDIATRTQGDIYIGVVGPVRTGKSTFIKRFIDSVVLPNIEGEYQKERAIDELPQSAAGRTIMTTEPKFVPEEAVEIALQSNASFRVRMVDCVGFVVPSAIGYIEEEQPRMVRTPWFDHEIPFNTAAEIGTKKVISEHSTIGLVITTDGSISDIPRAEYEEAEERVIEELRAINKPFVVLLNCTYPNAPEAVEMAENLTEKYGVPVVPVNCLELGESEITEILSQVLFEFPVKEVSIGLPGWISGLNDDHWLRKDIFSLIEESCKDLYHIRDVNLLSEAIGNCEHIEMAAVSSMNLAVGSAEIAVTANHELFYQILAETTGLEINDEQELMTNLMELSKVKKKYDRIKGALDEMEATGYGIVTPELEELTLEEPELMKQGGRYGVRLRASAPSIHMMKANITTEVTPIVGSESQGEDLVLYMMKEFEENPSEIWESDMFGKSLYSIVNEGLHNKLYRMPSEARMKMQETIERVINEGCSGLVCIIL